MSSPIPFEPNTVLASRKHPWLGSVVGALVGGVGQYLILVLFFILRVQLGRLFFRNHGGVSLPALVSSYPAWIFFGLSAGLGGLGGALGGMTRRLARGAAQGGGDVTDYSTDTWAVALSLVATMTKLWKTYRLKVKTPPHF